MEALSFQALEFWAHFYKHWNFPLIVPNTGILPYFNLYTLAFLSYPFKRRNFSPTFIHIDFFILSFKTLGFSPYSRSRTLEFCPTFINIQILIFFFQTLECSGLFLIHFFSYAILPNTGIMALFLYTLVFSSYSLKPWNSGAIFVGIAILFLSFYGLVFWPYFYNH